MYIYIILGHTHIARVDSASGRGEKLLPLLQYISILQGLVRRRSATGVANNYPIITIGKPVQGVDRDLFRLLLSFEYCGGLDKGRLFSSARRSNKCSLAAAAARRRLLRRGSRLGLCRGGLLRLGGLGLLRRHLGHLLHFGGGGCGLLRLGSCRFR